MIIGTIVDGIVIDHIPAGRAMDLYRDLGWTSWSARWLSSRTPPAASTARRTS